ncbi:hypothetical protein HPB48_012328 [Haemaphysalis longicornis]|uniref:Uncharacterized protein n=1 Tax=Haemaphysalis longicornis TaxID=44386 RepID=A0A9J6G498_HAELO|nr:hypothetical protein HPB48_012328 [Haemaphysalis longicornis]
MNSTEKASGAKGFADECALDAKATPRAPLIPHLPPSVHSREAGPRGYGLPRGLSPNRARPVHLETGGKEAESRMSRFSGGDICGALLMRPPLSP